MGEDTIIDGYSHGHRRSGDYYSGYANGGRSGGDHEVADDEGAVRVSHRVSGINFTPTLHDSLVNEIRKLKNKLDKRENEVKLLSEELGTFPSLTYTFILHTLHVVR